MLIVGLTGGIASGKSTVARQFRALGAILVDADQLSRVAVEPGSPGLARVAERFGAGVIDAGGALDRPALGAIVFADPAARKDLEAIIHPEVHRLFAEAIAQAEKNDPHAIVVYDVPLLVEADRGRVLDVIVVCSAPEEVRIDRMINSRGMSRDDAAARVRAQAREEDRLAVADYVINTTQTLEATSDRVAEIWAELRAQETQSA